MGTNFIESVIATGLEDSEEQEPCGVSVNIIAISQNLCMTCQTSSPYHDEDTCNNISSRESVADE